MSPLLDDIKGFDPCSIINLAMDKLVGGTTFTCWKKDKDCISIVEALAILGPRLNIDIVPQSEYASSLMSNFVLEGEYHGKLIARLLLLKVWDDIYKKLNTPSTRIHILVSFTGAEFGKAYIKFTHIISIMYTPNRKDLLDALIHESLNEEPSEDRISYTLIQVKNLTKDVK
ncbi:371_t:CDS:2, partial [Dentiscutata heterogama]